MSSRYGVRTTTKLRFVTMSLYTKNGIKMHANINSYFKNDRQYTGSAQLREILQKLTTKQQLDIVDTEIYVKGINNISGIIDALFKRRNKNEYVIVDWKHIHRLPTKHTLNKYDNLELNRLTKFYNDTILKYILQINLYKLLLLTASTFRDEYSLTWENVSLCIVFLNEENHHYSSYLYECKQFTEMDLKSLLYVYCKMKK